MWLDFFIAIPLCVIFLYIPGLLLARIFSSDHIALLALAPALSLLAYAILAIIYQKLGIFASWISLFFPLLLLAAVGLILQRYVLPQFLGADSNTKTGMKTSVLTKEGSGQNVALVGMYLLIGLALVFIFYVKPLDGPSSFTWRTDNCVHLNLIARFVETGNWSTLATSLYADPSRGAISSVGYYPAAWHIIPSLLSSALDLPATLTANVANAVLMGVIIPLSQLFFLRTLVPEKPFVQQLGALFPLAFGVFPWRILTQDARSLFVLGLIFGLVAMGVFISCVESALSKQRFGRQLVLFVLCLVATVVVHPIGIFTAGVLLVPYCLSALWRWATRDGDKRQSRRRGILYGLAFLIFVALMWALCLRVPMIHAMTLWYRPAYTHKSAAFVRALFMGFKDVPAQPLLAVFVWLGILYTFWRKRYLWLSLGFASFSGLYILCATSNGALKRVLCVFWYMDFNRIAASAAMIAVSLAALGLYVCMRVLQQAFLLLTQKDEARQRFARVSLPILCAVVAAGIIFYPNYRLPHQSGKTITAFGYVSQRTKDYNSKKTHVLDDKEERFVAKVKRMVGDDLVLNCPLDGSCFTYATDNLNVYYRRYHNWMYLNDTARYLARHLHEYSSDTTVQTMISDLDARYVLLLDAGFAKSSTLYWESYTSAGWQGFISLANNTTGFELVLSEGDMRLYRIVR